MRQMSFDLACLLFGLSLSPRKDCSNYTCPDCNNTPRDVVEEESISEQTDGSEDDWDSEQDEHLAFERQDRYVSWLSTLQKLQESNPILYFVMKQKVEKNASYNEKTDWPDIVKMISAVDPDYDITLLDQYKPPQKLGRKMDRLFPIGIKKKTLEVKRDELVFNADFYYRDLAEVVFQLVSSPANLANVPMYKIGPDCPAQGRWGTRITELLDSFISQKKVKVNDMVLALQIYSDGNKFLTMLLFVLNSIGTLVS
jgi:hypothetical protein